MCGIVGITGTSKAVEMVLTGLGRLEYRGYDSAGLATLIDGHIETRKAVGKLKNLQASLEAQPLPATCNLPPVTCIGHTRWATHGSPTTANAHPHLANFMGQNIAVVHNGIIENYQSLRESLTSQGAIFQSETDTEVVPYGLAKALTTQPNPLQALHSLTQTFHGNYALGIIVASTPTTLLATRKGAPLCLALGNGWNALVSDPLALAGATSKFIYLEDGDCAEITPTSIHIIDATGTPVQRPTTVLDLSEEAGGKQGHRHFMVKEIHEQPAVIARMLEAYTTPEGTLNLPITLPAAPTAINIVACGTAYYAGCVGKYFIEDLAGVPVNVDVASEFRYRNPPLPKGGIFIAVSQSGETADTLAALEHAKQAGQYILVITNSPTSSMARAAHAVLPLLAGREIAVASTKAFTAMVLAMVLVALKLAANQKSTPTTLAALRHLPNLLEQLLTNPAPLQALAEKLKNATSMLYLGRGGLAPLALEGALKMKECAYIHAEGYASGEMKHGPIALVDGTLPVINLASGHDGLFAKTLSNLREVEARHGQVVLITDPAGTAQLDAATRANLTLIEIPGSPPEATRLLAPILFSIPLQLLAYHTATAKGTDVDQPRNLAKSVTVE